MTKIQAKRIEKGMTQTELAYKAGISVHTLIKYENGERLIDGAKIKTLLLLSRALHCSLTDILEEEETILLLDNAHIYA